MSTIYNTVVYTTVLLVILSSVPAETKVRCVICNSEANCKAAFECLKNVNGDVKGCVGSPSTYTFSAPSDFCKGTIASDKLTKVEASSTCDRTKAVGCCNGKNYCWPVALVTCVTCNNGRFSSTCTKVSTLTTKSSTCTYCETTYDAYYETAKLTCGTTELDWDEIDKYDNAKSPEKGVIATLPQILALKLTTTLGNRANGDYLPATNEQCQTKCTAAGCAKDLAPTGFICRYMYTDANNPAKYTFGGVTEGVSCRPTLDNSVRCVKAVSLPPAKNNLQCYDCKFQDNCPSNIGAATDKCYKKINCLSKCYARTNAIRQYEYGCLDSSICYNNDLNTITECKSSLISAAPSFLLKCNRCPPGKASCTYAEVEASPQICRSCFVSRKTVVNTVSFNFGCVTDKPQAICNAEYAIAATGTTKCCSNSHRCNRDPPTEDRKPIKCYELNLGVGRPLPRQTDQPGTTAAFYQCKVTQERKCGTSEWSYTYSGTKKASECQAVSTNDKIIKCCDTDNCVPYHLNHRECYICRKNEICPKSIARNQCYPTVPCAGPCFARTEVNMQGVQKHTYGCFETCKTSRTDTVATDCWNGTLSNEKAPDMTKPKLKCYICTTNCLSAVPTSPYPESKAECESCYARRTEQGGKVTYTYGCHKTLTTCSESTIGINTDYCCNAEHRCNVRAPVRKRPNLKCYSTGNKLYTGYNPTSQLLDTPGNNVACRAERTKKCSTTGVQFEYKFFGVQKGECKESDNSIRMIRCCNDTDFCPLFSGVDDINRKCYSCKGPKCTNTFNDDCNSGSKTVECNENLCYAKSMIDYSRKRTYEFGCLGQRRCPDSTDRVKWDCQTGLKIAPAIPELKVRCYVCTGTCPQQITASTTTNITTADNCSRCYVKTTRVNNITNTYEYGCEKSNLPLSYCPEVGEGANIRRQCCFSGNLCNNKAPTTILKAVTCYQESARNSFRPSVAASQVQNNIACQSTMSRQCGKQWSDADQTVFSFSGVNHGECKPSTTRYSETRCCKSNLCLSFNGTDKIELPPTTLPPQRTVYVTKSAGGSVKMLHMTQTATVNTFVSMVLLLCVRALF